MGTRYEFFDTQWTTMTVHAAGAPVELADYDHDVLQKHAINITDYDDGALIFGSKRALVELLENALRQAHALPEDPDEQAETPEPEDGQPTPAEPKRADTPDQESHQ
ncbi:hypothetical protein [Nonomuraea sp. SYSU D8015]|uniref:hypothetical protein n=1 Tax=Nonomuraea sp. SYSU D8015 TaxID=2593644 RepID=UPI00166145C4|nr:hypothetical protein [Nonomuraea sp. SYSU D8015]